MTQLRIAQNLTLPIDLVVEATAVVGKRGRGKTYTSKRIVEEVLRACVTVVVIDPTDVWWGLRSGADGSDRGGLDVVVIGGKHGDLPIHNGTGKMLARLVLDGTSIVLVPKGLAKADRRRLVGEFLAELYDRADGTPVLVVIDEADEYAPQSTGGYGGNRTNDPLTLSLGAVEDIVRRGRAGGLGSLLITQRVAVLSKNVLEQSDTLIALGVTGKNDIDAVAAWIAKHAPDTETGQRITSSLPRLPKGTAWVWAPEYDVLEQVEVLPITTFDSSRSPKVGEVAVTPKARKSIDLAELGEEMARFADEVKADDPAELRKQIAELKRHRCPEPAAVEPERVDVPILTEDDRRRIENFIQVWDDAYDRSAEIVNTLRDALARVDHATQLQRSSRLEKTTTRTPVTGRAAGNDRPASPAASTARSTGPRTDPAPRSRPANPPPPAGDGSLSDPQQRVLDAVEWLHTVGYEQPTKGQVGFIAGYRVGKKVGGAYGNYLGQLRTEGLIDYPSPGTVALTEAGRAQALPAAVDMTTAVLQAAIFDRLTDPEQRVLRGIVDAYPDAITKQQAGAAAGYTVGPKVGGAFGNILGKLRSLGLIDYPSPGSVVATSVLFLRGR